METGLTLYPLALKNFKPDIRTRCIKIIVPNFRESESIIKKSGRSLVRILEVVQNVQQIVEDYPSTSIRRLRQQVSLSQKILKKDINSFPYKIGVLHHN
jgi:ribosome-binding protein aMBF1 (putative translation factor)